VAARAKPGILIGPKGRGSNMMANARACADPEFPAEIQVVISPKEDTPAVLEARNFGLSVVVIPPDGDDYGQRLMDASKECELVCLAGFLRLLPSEVLAAFPRRILNIHPALLPKFGGKGMYGMRVHEAVLAAGELESGCSVHYVTEHYDEGEIILQRRVPVESGDTAESLAARVLEQEHLAFPEAIRKVLEER